MSARAQGRGVGAVLFWLAICVGLAVAVRWQWRQPPATIEVAATAPAPTTPTPLAPAPDFTPPAFGEFAETLERPLFSPTRRPAPPSSEPEPTLDTPTGDFILIGVVITPTESLALVQQKGAQAPIRIALGQMVNGWTLETVEADRVTFRFGENAQEVKLRDDVPPQRAKRRPGAQPAQPAQRGQPAQDQAASPPPAPQIEPAETPENGDEG
jgi:hypothetical protein